MHANNLLLIDWICLRWELMSTFMLKDCGLNKNIPETLAILVKRIFLTKHQAAREIYLWLRGKLDIAVVSGWHATHQHLRARPVYR